MPYLHALGEGWEQGKVSVAVEHFASNLLRGRLAAFARGWGLGHGPLAILACAPGEQHDIALIAFGIVLHRHGWRVEYLGADTPIDDLTRMASEVRADLAVLAAVTPERFDGLTSHLSRLAHIVPLAIAGAGATKALADAVPARLLTGDPVTEAERMPPPRWSGGR
jgi:methanogenic corrinoid protein MtbC1